MKINKIFLLWVALLPFHHAIADETPSISPTAVFIKSDGTEEESTKYSGNAPLRAVFSANPSNVGAYTAAYEWRFSLGTEDTPYLVRHEENTEYTFNKAGTHKIELYATFISGKDTIRFTEEYWTENTPISVTINESILEMPNAFSPNGDSRNEVYKAKKYQSLVEFHAYIFNRWGQKLFEWDNPAEGWNGKYKGQDVKQGVYYVLVKAKGADGRVYNIRKDVNLLRGYTETGRSENNY
ncbi:MAG: gliding motility-associated C-terminal domain-containing protein [Prevotella sp.]|nr:gliding motility-associated C-terminal domain-containing protein [Prevotella sp.]